MSPRVTRYEADAYPKWSEGDQFTGAVDGHEFSGPLWKASSGALYVGTTRVRSGLGVLTPGLTGYVLHPEPEPAEPQGLWTLARFPNGWVALRMNEDPDAKFPWFFMSRNVGDGGDATVLDHWSWDSLVSRYGAPVEILDGPWKTISAEPEGEQPETSSTMLTGLRDEAFADALDALNDMVGRLRRYANAMGNPDLQDAFREHARNLESVVLRYRPYVEDLDWTPTSGAERIADERLRQIVEEGYTAEHDVSRAKDLALAASCYAAPTDRRALYYMPEGTIPADWPWAREDWKPTPDDRVRELIKAGALCAAAIDAIQAETQEKTS